MKSNVVVIFLYKEYASEAYIATQGAKETYFDSTADALNRH